MHIRRLGAMALAAAWFLGCGGDDSPTEPPPPAGSTIVKVSGDGQSGPVSTQLPLPLTVRVQDSGGQPLSGRTVSWALAGAAGPNARLSATSTTTGSDGQTSVTFSLGDTEGQYQVRASISGSSVTFTEMATTAGASGLEIASGNAQVGFAGTALTQPLTVRALATGGGPAPGVAVQFAITQQAGAGASLSAATVTTGSDGLASTILTLGDAAGLFRVSATSDAGSVEFTANACGGDAAAGELTLAPGEDAILSGGAAVSCVQLPAHAAGAEYEVIYTSARQSAGPPASPVTLGVGGVPVGGGPQVVVGSESGVRGAGLQGAVSLGPTERMLEAWRRRQYAFDVRLREEEANILPAMQRSGPSFGLAAVPSVGDTLDFVFSCVTPSQFPNAPDSITGVVKVVSTRAVIVEDTVAAGAFTGTEYGEIAGNFDNLIFATDTTYFGSPDDVDANGGRVVLLYSAGVNNLSDSYSSGFISGFFCGSDLSTFGNNAEMFYLMVPDPNGDYTPSGETIDKAFVRMATDNTVAHEFQHMINAWRRAQAGLGAMDVWLNEGLSHLAEEVNGHAANGFTPGTELGPAELLGSQQAVDNFNKYYRNDIVNLATYLVVPADTAALVTLDDPLGIGTFRMRGAAWGFLRYLLDRFDTASTEAQRVRGLVVESAADARDEVASAFGTPFDQLITEWNGMYAVEDRMDLGGAPRAELLLSSYQLRTFYDSPQISSFIDGVLGSLGLPQPGGYPLRPVAAGLATTTAVDAELYPGIAQFVRLTAPSGSGGTGLRLQDTGSGADVAASVEPRLIIIRTK